PIREAQPVMSGAATAGYGPSAIAARRAAASRSATRAPSRRSPSDGRRNTVEASAGTRNVQLSALASDVGPAGRSSLDRVPCEENPPTETVPFFRGVH